MSFGEPRATRLQEGYVPVLIIVKLGLSSGAIGVQVPAVCLAEGTLIAHECIEIPAFMEIRFVSSLTPEDEVRLAEGLLKAFTCLLDQWPIAYTLRIDAGDATVLQHSHAPAEPVGGRPQSLPN